MSRLSIILFVFLFLLSSCDHNIQFLQETRQLPYYPSASAIEYIGNDFYIIGDDATHLLKLDSSLNVIDSIALFESQSRRIPKDIKPDIEAITAIASHREQYLLMIGSGSLFPYRNAAILYRPSGNQITRLVLDTFYNRLLKYGLPELNIEGLCAIPGSLVLVNRGHKAFPKNYLVLTSSSFWSNQAIAPIDFIKIGANSDSNSFKGVSGATYAKKCDKLILTVSTEDTRSSYEDGTIGKSYLWIVDNFSSKKRWNAINPNRVIDLENVDATFRGYKIESACVIRETTHFIQLALVADNDKGSSTIFRLDISKK